MNRNSRNTMEMPTGFVLVPLVSGVVWPITGTNTVAISIMAFLRSLVRERLTHAEAHANAADNKQPPATKAVSCPCRVQCEPVPVRCQIQRQNKNHNAHKIPKVAFNALIRLMV